jgi:hypothetical protein
MLGATGHLKFYSVLSVFVKELHKGYISPSDLLLTIFTVLSSSEEWVNFTRLYYITAQDKVLFTLNAVTTTDLNTVITEICLLMLLHLVAS